MTLSNQTSRYILKCIRMIVLLIFRMFAANILHFGTTALSFVEYLANGCRYFPNISYLDIY